MQAGSDKAFREGLGTWQQEPDGVQRRGDPGQRLLGLGFAVEGLCGKLEAHTECALWVSSPCAGAPWGYLGAGSRLFASSC